MQLAQDMGRQYGSQSAFDAAEPSEDRRAELIKLESTQFAEEFCTMEMDDQAFFKYADEFGGEALGDALSADDQQYLLQLLIKYRDDDLAKPAIDRLRQAAYKHKEGQLNGQQ